MYLLDTEGACDSITHLSQARDGQACGLIYWKGHTAMSCVPPSSSSVKASRTRVRPGAHVRGRNTRPALSIKRRGWHGMRFSLEGRTSHSASFRLTYASRDFGSARRSRSGALDGDLEKARSLAGSMRATLARRHIFVAERIHTQGGCGLPDG